MSHVPELKWEPVSSVEAIDWNHIEDQKDLEVWNRLTGNFWLPEKVPLSNDIASWNRLDDDEKTLVMHVFAGLTLLDTIQGEAGAVRLMHDAITPHEKAVFGNITFMEAFAGDTMLLTPRGWKRISDVTADDTVAQFDPADHGISFAHPTLVAPHYADSVYEIAAADGTARQVVSSGHRVYVEHRSDGTWSPKTYEAHELAGLDLNDYDGRFVTAGRAADGDGMTAADELGLAIRLCGSPAGGSRIGDGDDEPLSSIVFGMHDQSRAKRLVELALAAGWGIRELRGDDADRRFVLSVPHSSRQAIAAGRLASIRGLDEASLSWSRGFIDSLAFWSGSASDDDGMTYLTTSAADAGFVVAVAALAGFGASYDADDSGAVTRYSVRVSYANDSVPAGDVSVSAAEPQEVYCVQVPTTYLLTWAGASPVISGNCVHAKSYSYIFQTLASTRQIEAAFDWSNANEYLQKKAQNVLGYYNGDDPLEVKVMSVLLESFLFYSGFFLPFWMSAHAKLTNVADVIRLILRDESIHGYYIGYKYQIGLERLDDAGRDRLRDFAYDQVDALYANEVEYTKTLYGPVGLVDKVIPFLKYNANKALQNLGYEGLYPADECDVDPAIMSTLSPNADENHDFFSGSGSSYTMGNVAETDDEDWDF